MKNRIKHSIYLAPAVFLLLLWIATAPNLIVLLSPWQLVGVAALTAGVATWCITLFAHALQRDRP